MRKRGKRGLRGFGCELPEEMTAGSIRITLYGRRGALIEGHCGVVEMSDTHIQLKSACGMIGLHGSEMKIKELSFDSAMVRSAGMDSLVYDEKLERGGSLCGSDV